MATGHGRAPSTSVISQYKWSAWATNTESHGQNNFNSRHLSWFWRPGVQGVDGAGFPEAPTGWQTAPPMPLCTPALGVKVYPNLFVS